MADPQTQTAAANQAKSANRPADGQTAQEPRSFEPSRAAEAAGRQTKQAGEAVRDLAETSRRQANQAVETWRNALDPFTALHMDMNRWFDDLWRRSTGMSAPALRPAGLMGALGPAPLFGMPAADLRETDDLYLITIELAGLTREDIDLQVRGDLLILSGHKMEEKEDGAAAYRLSERRFGRFERSFPIPPDADPSAIDAQFKDGVLKITLPRHAERGPKSSKVEIK